MKKSLVLTAAVFLCFALGGCGEKTVGVIGGADGPTSVYVSENNKQSQKESVRLVRVDGKLYYDSKAKKRYGRALRRYGRCACQNSGRV